MADLTARQDHWTDYLPQSWQHNINTSPILNALGRALNRQTPNLERAALDTYGTPEQQAEADRQWLLQKAQGPSWLDRNPSAADGLNKLGMLANFVGPGVKLPAAQKPTGGIRIGVSRRNDGRDMLSVESDVGSVRGLIDPTRNRIEDPASGILEGFRGQGHGVELYRAFVDEALRRGLTINSANPVTFDAARVYDALARRGYNVTKNPAAIEDKPAGAWVVNNKPVGEDSVFVIEQQAQKPAGIRAYHGSPHDFDKFDINKIGTGEGAQAYGRGLYFAESEGVAKSYRDALGGKGSVSPYAQSMLSVSGSNIDAALSAIKARLRRPGGFPLAKDEERQALIALSELTDMKLNGALTGPGRMYEVRINADPEQFLDWDKPLAQQPEAVRRLAQGMPETATGEQIYRSIAERPRQGQRSGDPLNDVLFDIPVTDHADAARRLREAGVPGTRYLDQGSRDVGSGTRNYAVWDDKLIEILRKYGLLPPVAAGTAAALNQEQPQQ